MKKSNTSIPIIEASPDGTKPGRFLRRPDVTALTGLKVSTIYKMMAAGKFPRPIKISRSLAVWSEDEVAAWQAECIAERNQQSRKRR